MVSWYIKWTLYKRFLNWNKILKKVKWLLTKLLVIVLFGTPHSVCLNINFWYGSFVWNDAFPILVLSDKKWYSIFLKKSFAFKKICCKVKVLKTFEISTDRHIKKVPISQTESYFENSQYCFLEEPKCFPVLRQKPTQILP